MWEIEIFYGCWMSRAFLHAGVMKTVAWENIILHILYFFELPPVFSGGHHQPCPVAPCHLWAAPGTLARQSCSLLMQHLSPEHPEAFHQGISPTVLLAC